LILFAFLRSGSLRQKSFVGLKMLVTWTPCNVHCCKKRRLNFEALNLNYIRTLLTC